jgi:hypothetical protein
MNVDSRVKLNSDVAALIAEVIGLCDDNCSNNAFDDFAALVIAAVAAAVEDVV